MRVLIAVDVADGAERLVQIAVVWVARLRARADLVYVLPVDVEDGVDDPEGRLQSLLVQVPPEHRGQGHIAAGRVTSTLAELASSYDAILVGSGPRARTARLLGGGSVGRGMLARSAVPVIALRTETVGDAA